MQVEAKGKIDLEENIKVVIGDLEAQIQKLDEQRAELVVSLKLHRKMLNLALGDKDANKGKAEDDKGAGDTD